MNDYTDDLYSLSLAAAVQLLEKLAVLADAAKYDASCASSGSNKRTSKNGRGIGSTGATGICHSYAPDGRCISLLKVLLTNFCIYECSYCVNRSSSNVPRARFAVAEVVQLTLDFYRRNYIEGLFLSSGIIRNPDYTMEQVVAVARSLREDHDFRGYIHLKTIPDTAPELLAAAGRYADRVSINLELPTQTSLARLAPEKNLARIKLGMTTIAKRIEESGAAVRAPRYAPAGQSTQMIVGADATTDQEILATAGEVYTAYRLKRVYYSAFSPIPDASPALPLKAAPLVREHRLYQADWLLRLYGFAVDEMAAEKDGMLPLDIDPKLAWALRHRHEFPVDVNTAGRELLVRVPGIGLRGVARIMAARRFARLRLNDLARLKINLKNALPFVITLDHRPLGDPSSDAVRAGLAPRQAELF